MNENEFKWKGKTYVAVESSPLHGCSECDLFDAYNEEMECLWCVGEIPLCISNLRKDKRSVIFKLKGEEKND